MTADVTFVTDESKECVYISRKAIVEENGKQYVYKKSGDEYVLSPIETGFTNGAYTEIVSGVEEGESYYIESVVVEETTDDEADTNQETGTQDGEQSTGMNMPSDMNNMNNNMNNMPNMGQGGMGGGGQR
jgi:hypothetical protein